MLVLVIENHEHDYEHEHEGTIVAPPALITACPRVSPPGGTRMALHLERGSVDLTADAMDLRQVLMELFMLMEVKYDLPPEVQGTVTIRLHNASFAQALDQLLGHDFVYDIGPHDVVYVHRRGTTWMPGGKTPQ